MNQHSLLLLHTETERYAEVKTFFKKKKDAINKKVNALKTQNMQKARLLSCSNRHYVLTGIDCYGYFGKIHRGVIKVYMKTIAQNKNNIFYDYRKGGLPPAFNPCILDSDEIHLWLFVQGVITVTPNNCYSHPTTIQRYNEVKTCVYINTTWVLGLLTVMFFHLVK